MSPNKEDSMLEACQEIVGETESLNSPGAKKAFIEPAISLPVDVLEATAFFQGPTASGGGTD